MSDAKVKFVREIVKIAKAEGLARLIVGDVTVEPIAAEARPVAMKPREPPEPEASGLRREIAQTLGIPIEYVAEDEILTPKLEPEDG